VVIAVIASNSAPPRRDAGVAAADQVEEEFLALVYADEELLRAEFDALIAATWGQPRQPAHPRRARRPTPPPRRRPRPGFAQPGRMRAQHDPGAEGRTPATRTPRPHQQQGTTSSGSRKAVWSAI
jgi:hypothetical protein